MNSTALADSACEWRAERLAQFMGDTGRHQPSTASSGLDQTVLGGAQGLFGALAFGDLTFAGRRPLRRSGGTGGDLALQFLNLACSSMARAASAPARQPPALAEEQPEAGGNRQPRRPARRALPRLDMDRRRSEKTTSPGRAGRRWRLSARMGLGSPAAAGSLFS